MTCLQNFEIEPLGPPLPPSRKAKDHTGRRVGRLTLTKAWIRQKSNPPGYGWLARCDCGRWRVDLPVALARVNCCTRCGDWEITEQQTTRTLTVSGRTQTLGKWSEETGVPVAELSRRMDARWLPVQIVGPDFFADLERHQKESHSS
ncbi:MAG: hypothetical protein NXI04_15890 [Planctomycetaceae bacterium]|nr:hypothetical protein [Planctomycetaceae bacterium]